MKYLKKINEDKNYDAMLYYIKSCFIDFIDNDKVIIDMNTYRIELELKEPKSHKLELEVNDMALYIEHSEEVLEFYKDLDVCLKKFKISYNNLIQINRFVINHNTLVIIEIKL